MIGEVRSGSSFRGLTHYLLHGSGENRKSPEWVVLRNLHEIKPGDAYLEMEATASQSARVRKPVFHVVLSPAEGDEMTRERWLALADRVLGDLGLGEHEAMVVLHADTDHPHLHLAVNRVHPETLRAWGTWRSKIRLEGILREVEREWGLRVVPGRLVEVERSVEWEERPPGLTTGERAQLHHRAEEPQVLAWRRDLREAFEGATSWTELAGRLQVNGVHLVARGRGMVVSDGDVYVKLSRLDRGWSRGRLEERFGQPFAEWRKEMRQFEEAGRLYPRYAARGPDHPRARAAVRTLRRTGRSLGWRALGELQGPLSPAVSGVALAARRRARLLDGEREGAWASFSRRYLGPALDRAGSWAEAESRLAFYGAWLGRGEGSGELLVTDGRHVSPVAEVGSRFRVERLEERWGSWREWERTRHRVLAAARRYQRAEEPRDGDLERWRRLRRAVRASEERVGAYKELLERHREAERRLRGLLRRETRASGEAVGRVVRRVGSAPADRVEELLRSLQPRRLGVGRRRGPSEAVREAAREYRGLVVRLSRAAPPARSAARRVERLRQQAWLRNPGRLRQEHRRVLAAAVRPVLRTGVRSLVARAAPGLGPALSMVRFLGRIDRQLSRDLDRSR